jgi:hypothetical protein
VLKNRRLVATGGNISKIAKQLKINLDEEYTTEDITAKTLLYKYQNGQYNKINL